MNTGKEFLFYNVFFPLHVIMEIFQHAEKYEKIVE